MAGKGGERPFYILLELPPKRLVLDAYPLPLEDAKKVIYPSLHTNLDIFFSFYAPVKDEYLMIIHIYKYLKEIHLQNKFVIMHSSIGIDLTERLSKCLHI